MEQRQICLKDAVVCTHSGAEVTTLQQIDRLVTHQQYQVVQLLAQGDLKCAMQVIEQTLKLKHHPFLFTLKAFIHYQIQVNRRQQLSACVEAFFADDQPLS